MIMNIIASIEPNSYSMTTITIENSRFPKTQFVDEKEFILLFIDYTKAKLVCPEQSSEAVYSKAN